MYKEKNGKDPTDDEVKQWMVTLREAAEQRVESKVPPRGVGAPLAAAVPTMMALGPAVAGDPLGLGQSHLKASDLGLPSFGVQAVPKASATQSPSLSPMAQLNCAFLDWMQQQLGRAGGTLDLSPGLNDYLAHAAKLASDGVAVLASATQPVLVKLPTWRERDRTPSSLMAATPPASPIAGADEAEERALADKSLAQQESIKDKFRNLIEFMQLGVDRLQQQHGDNYEVTPEDIDAIKRAFAATSSSDHTIAASLAN